MLRATEGARGRGDTWALAGASAHAGVPSAVTGSRGATKSRRQIKSGGALLGDVRVWEGLME